MRSRRSKFSATWEIIAYLPRQQEGMLWLMAAFLGRLTQVLALEPLAHAASFHTCPMISGGHLGRPNQQNFTHPMLRGMKGQKLLRYASS